MAAEVVYYGLQILKWIAFLHLLLFLTLNIKIYLLIEATVSCSGKCGVLGLTTKYRFDSPRKFKLQLIHYEKIMS